MLYRRCPICRVVGPFQLNSEVDASVASLAVSCQHFNRTSGTACRWTGRLEDFDKHTHVFRDQRQQDPATIAAQDRGTKRRRSDDEDADDPDKDDTEIQPPSRKVSGGCVPQLDHA